MGVSYINFSVVRFAVCLALGITVSYWTDHFEIFTGSVETLYCILISLVVFLCTIWIWNKNTLTPAPLFGVIVYLLFFSIGFINHSQWLPKYQSNHYTNKLSSSERTFLQLKILSIVKPNTYYSKYIAEVHASNGRSTRGKILFQVQKDSTSLTVDDVVLVYSHITPIPPPKNPHQFTYGTYMKTLGVYGQVQLSSSALIISETGSTTLVGFAEQLRSGLLISLKHTPLQPDERSIVQALVLGQRQDIDKELYKEYAAAGAIHILAVSGLHVGILYGMLLVLFKPLIFIKHGALVRSICIIMVLWGFAFLAGVSPSVVRAVTMFTFFTFATALKRPTNSFNTLFLSFFILLLFQPNWLFQVGFQLSYLAVFAILWIQPKLYQLYTPKFYLDKLFWGILTVTIAAQLGILPLSLYYFHQFPGLFILTNIVILPVLGMILIGGLLIIILAAYGALPDSIAHIFNTAITLLNTFISWVAHQDAFLFQNIPFSIWEMVGSYLLLVALVLVWKHYQYKRVVVCLASISLFFAIVLWEKRKAHFSEMVVFNKSRKTILGIKENRHFTLLKTDTIVTNLSKKYPIDTYIKASRIETVSELRLPKYFHFKDHAIVVVDSIGVYHTACTSAIIILTQSPKINLDRLIDSLQPLQIIADGSNYNSYVQRWRETCRNKKLPFHHTGIKGAFTLK